MYKSHEIIIKAYIIIKIIQDYIRNNKKNIEKLNIELIKTFAVLDDYQWYITNNFKINDYIFLEKLKDIKTNIDSLI
jgi:hypothetical protein